MTKSACIKNASTLSLRHYSAKTANHAKQRATIRNQVSYKLAFMGNSPVCTARDTQPSEEQTKPHPLCDEMGTPDNTLSHDSRENVN